MKKVFPFVLTFLLFTLGLSSFSFAQPADWMYSTDTRLVEKPAYNSIKTLPQKPRKTIEDYPCDVLLGVHVNGWYNGSHSSPDGALVVNVIAGSPAEKVAFAKEDRILAVEDLPVDSYTSLDEALQTFGPGARVNITINRDGEALVKSVVLRDCEGPTLKKVLEEEAEKVLDEETEEVYLIEVPGEDDGPAATEKPNEDPVLDVDEEVIAEGPVAFTLSPNPSRGEVRLSLSADETFEGGRIEVYSIQGQRIFSEPLPPSSGTCQRVYNLSDATPGLYFVSLIQNGKTYTEPLSIVR